MSDKFLPISKQEMLERDWHYVDILLITGDAYVDHPSFGAAVIGRVLEKAGFRVGILAQPDWRSVEAFKEFGPPRIAIMITAGNLDSMVNHYTAAKKPRSQDAFSPGGKMGLRPDRATLVYAQKAKEAFKGKPVIIGGIEASLRRFAHYDYWSDKVRRSILIDAKADLLVYGMGERQVEQLCQRLKKGETIAQITDLPGTAWVASDLNQIGEHILIPGYEAVTKSKRTYAEAFAIQYKQQDPYRGSTLVQSHGDQYLVQNPPVRPLSQKELDTVFSLPFQRTYHPNYQGQGGVPAIEEVQYSLISSRGCFGSCSFCALTFHQGRIVQARSHQSILTEAEKMIWEPGFKGYIHDVGGPTANFRGPACQKQEKKGSCAHRQCLFPKPCPNLKVEHQDYLDLLRKLRTLPKVKKVFVRSGVRYDYLMADQNTPFFRELCEHHVSGQLKVAPEHVHPDVLKRMGKPGGVVFDKFVEKFKAINQKIGKQQYLVPYFMSSHPGSGLNEAIALAEYIRDMGYNPEQVQDFIPTPGSLSTCMFYTGLDPLTMEKVYVPKSPHEKAMQRALLQYRNPKNYQLVYEALQKAGRQDLIGFGPKCLIRPRRAQGQAISAQTKTVESSRQGNRPGKSNRTAKENRAAKDNRTVSGKNIKPKTTGGRRKKR